MSAKAADLSVVISHPDQSSAVGNHLVSVYLPTRNRLELLQRAIRSVLTQDYPYFEVLVVDDASDDATWPYLQQLSMADSRVRVWRNEAAEGACASRNRAIAAASGEFLTGLDDDDYFLPGHLTGLYASWCAAIAAGGRVAGVFPQRLAQDSQNNLHPLLYSPLVAAKDLLLHNFIGNQFFAPTQYYRDCGGFALEMPAWQDYECWYRMLQRFGVAHASHQASYVVDMSHDLSRISSRSAELLQQAYSSFVTRHLQTAPRVEVLMVRLLYLQYPQTDFSFGELMQYYRSGLLRRAIRLFVLKKMRSCCPRVLQKFIRGKNRLAHRQS